MYRYVGEKIKALALLLGTIGTIASIIFGLILIVENGRSYSTDLLTLNGLLVILAGSFSSWSLSLVLFGFGELIDQTTAINQRLQNSVPPSNPPTSAAQGTFPGDASSQGEALRQDSNFPDSQSRRRRRSG